MGFRSLRAAFGGFGAWEAPTIRDGVEGMRLGVHGGVDRGRQARIRRIRLRAQKDDLRLKPYPEGESVTLLRCQQGSLQCAPRAVRRRRACLGRTHYSQRPLCMCLLRTSASQTPSMHLPRVSKGLPV